MKLSFGAHNYDITIRLANTCSVLILSDSVFFKMKVVASSKINLPQWAKLSERSDLDLYYDLV